MHLLVIVELPEISETGLFSFVYDLFLERFLDVRIMILLKDIFILFWELSVINL